MSDRDRQPPPPGGDQPSEEELRASEAEQRAASRLAAGIEALLTGDGRRPARGEERDREPAAQRDADEALAAAVMISAAHREPELSRSVRDALIDEAIAGRGRGAAAPRRRWRAIAAAAAVLIAVGAALLVGRMSMHGQQASDGELARVSSSAGDGARQPRQLRSRPSNDLLGRPIRDRAGASHRLDRVFADRMVGYRRVMLARAGGAR